MSRVPASFGARRPASGLDADVVAAPGLLGHARALAADLAVPDLLRQAVFLAALVVAWVSLKPFADLSRLDSGDLVTGREALTYATFGLLALAALGLVLRDHRAALVSLATPLNLALGGWLCVGTVLSQDPATSIKRLTLSAAVVLLAACLPLLARSRAEMRTLMAIAALTLLGLCYLGMILVPDLTIHGARDLQEPHLAGNWRGVFGHKNAAAAVMAMMLIVGVAVFRSGLRIAGGAIVVLAAVFLVGSEGKSAFGLTFLVFAITGLFAVVRSLPGRAVLALGPVLLSNVFSVGTVMNEGLAAVVRMLPLDPSFTGRTAIWQFAIERIAERPVFGYGFAAFWGTQTIRDISDDGSSWAGYASHSHNGFLDVTITLGAVGLVLTLLVLASRPLRDYQRAAEGADGAGPFATMFLQLWLFALLLASMESFFFDRSDPIWFTLLIAVFGLHYLARFRTR